MTAEANRVSIRYLKESVWGTNPGGNGQDLRFTSDSLVLDKNAVESEEIRSDGNVADLVDVGQSASGGLGFELSYGTYDDVLESIMRSAWGSALTVTDTDISAANADSSFNSVGAGFPAFVAGQWIKVSGFTGDTSNNGFFRIVGTPTSSKIIVDATLVDDAAGESVTIKGQMIRNGVTEKSLTLEKAFLDKTQFFEYLGSIASEMSISFAAQGKVTGTFNFLGKGVTRSGTTGQGTVTVATTTDIMNASGHIGQIEENFNAYTGVISELSFSANSNLRGRAGVGSSSLTSIGKGTFRLTGTLQIYFEDGSMWDKMKANTATSLSFKTQDDAGNAYMFTLPSIKLGGGTPVAGGIDSDVIASYDFTGKKDSTTSCTMQIDKFAA